MSEFKTAVDPVLSDSQNPELGLIDEPRADLSQNINGYRIEAIHYDAGTRVTIDGRFYNGSFSDAIKVCGALPIRWNGLFY
jgi:hypothetical protein